MIFLLILVVEDRVPHRNLVPGLVIANLSGLLKGKTRKQRHVRQILTPVIVLGSLVGEKAMGLLLVLRKADRHAPVIVMSMA